MSTRRAAPLLVILAGFGAAPRCAPASEPVPFERDVVGFLAKHCVNCHGGKKPKGDISLEGMKTEADVVKGRKLWSSILRQIAEGSMPPAERPRPTAAELRAVEAAMKDVFRRADATRPRDPGHVTIRRLNRVEYNNTIRDLLMTELEPADDFPSDDSGHGFDNNSDVLSLSPTLLEHYLTAAEDVVSWTFANVKPQPPKIRSGTRQFLSPQTGTQDPQAITLYTSEPLVMVFRVAADGAYAVHFAAEAVNANDNPVAVAVSIDGKELQRLEFRNPNPKNPAVAVLPVPLVKGRHEVVVAFRNPTSELDANKGTNPPVIGKYLDKNRRGVTVKKADLVGPLDEISEGRRRILASKQPYGSAEHVHDVLARFASRAFRRPATAAEVRRYVKIHNDAREAGEDFEAAIQLALQGVLVSSNFLFRVELDDRPAGPEPRPISEHQLASRLSYFLWSSMPDDELLDLAAKGQLTANLESQVRRMIADPKSEAFVDNFASQWLGIRAIESATRNGREFHGYDILLRSEMTRETLLFFDAILRENRPVTELIDGQFTFINGRLAKHYGIVDVTGATTRDPKSMADPVPPHRFVRVPLEPGGPRGGVLTQASVLTITSNSDRTSPVKRGVWILERILGSPPPPPPPNVPELEAQEKVAENLSFRQRMELHRSKSECAACHARMDSLGFAFEKYDAIGRYRESDPKGPRGNRIDVSGKLPDGRSFNGASDLKKILVEKKDEFARCLAEKLLTYALGRGVEEHDAPALDRIVAATALDDYRMRTLIIEVAKSDPFRLRRGTPGARP